MPSAPLGRLGTALKQCQNCEKSETAEARLMSCAACKKSHYCDKACQKADWPKHKVACRINVATWILLKENKESLAESQPSNLVTAKDVESKLKGWIQIQKPLLSFSAVHALNLRVTPEKCMTHVLVINLSPNFSSPSKSSSRKKSAATSFLVSEAIVVPVSEESFGPGISDAVQQYGARSRQMRRNGQTGIAVVIVNVVEYHITHVTPLGIQGIPHMPKEKDWERNLKDTVNKGMVF